MTAKLKSTIEGIKTLSGIPEQGKRFLSVNLALVNFAELMDIAKELGCHVAPRQFVIDNS